MEMPVINKSSVPKAFLKKKGDLATAKDDGQLETLSVGPDGTVLAADSSQPTGFNWVSMASASGSVEWGSMTGSISDQNDLQTALNGRVATTTTVNGHPLSGSVSVTKSDVGLGNVTNDQQLTAAQLDTDATLAANSDTRVVSQKAIKTYIGNNFVPVANGVTNGNAHDHLGGDGAAISENALSLSDVTVGDVSSTRHGFAPKAPNNTNMFLRGDGTWAMPLAGGSATWASITNKPYYTCTPTSGDIPGDGNTLDTVLAGPQTGLYFLPPGTHTLSAAANRTLNAGATLIVGPGAIIAIPVNRTFTINGVLVAQPCQIFAKPDNPTVAAVRNALNNQPTWGSASSYNQVRLGDRYLVNGTGSGDWTGHNNCIAIATAAYAYPSTTGSWSFVTPLTGMVVHDDQNHVFRKYNGSSWDTLGKVVFGPGAMASAYFRWWGAAGDGVTEDTGAIQAALDSLAGTSTGNGSFALQGTANDNYLVTPVTFNGVNYQRYAQILGHGATLCQASDALPLGDGDVLTLQSALHNLRVQGWIIQGAYRFLWSQSGFTPGVTPPAITGTQRASKSACTAVGDYYWDQQGTIYIYQQPPWPNRPTITANGLANWIKYFAGDGIKITWLSTNCDSGSIIVKDSYINYVNRAYSNQSGLICNVDNLTALECNQVVNVGQDAISAPNMNRHDNINGHTIYGLDCIYLANGKNQEFNFGNIEGVAGRMFHIIGGRNYKISGMSSEAVCQDTTWAAAPNNMNEAFLLDGCYDVTYQCNQGGSGKAPNSMFNLINGAHNVVVRSNAIYFDRQGTNYQYQLFASADLSGFGVVVEGNAFMDSSATFKLSDIPGLITVLRGNTYHSTYGAYLALAPGLVRRANIPLKDWATYPRVAATPTPTLSGATGIRDALTGYLPGSGSYKVIWAASNNYAYWDDCFTQPTPANQGTLYPITSMWFATDITHTIKISGPSLPDCHLTIQGSGTPGTPGKWVLFSMLYQGVASPYNLTQFRMTASAVAGGENLWASCPQRLWFPSWSEAEEFLGSYNYGQNRGRNDTGAGGGVANCVSNYDADSLWFATAPVGKIKHGWPGRYITLQLEGAGQFNDNYLGFDKVFPYWGGAWQADQSAGTAYDYFPDAPAVGDCLYIGSKDYRFAAVYFTVNEVFNHTGVWEYSQGANTWAALTTTGSGLTSAGAQNIKFIPPADWQVDYLNNQYGFWIRFRVTVNGGTTGGSNQTAALKGGYIVTNGANITATTGKMNTIQLVNRGVWYELSRAVTP